MAAFEESIAAVKGKSDGRGRRKPAEAKTKKAAPKERAAKKRSEPKSSKSAGVASDPVVEVEGRELTLPNLDKVLYPEAGFTKGEVIDYYARVAARWSPT